MNLSIRLFNNEKELKINIFKVIFKQKEHEFARVAIAIDIKTELVTNIIIEGLFIGKNYYEVIEKDYKWYVFIAAPNDYNINNEENENILYCDPISHEIISIDNLNKENIVENITILEIEEFIPRKIPEFFIFKEYEHIIKEKEEYLNQTIIINKTLENNNSLLYLRFLKDLKNKTQNLEINNHKEYIELNFQYKINIKHIYNLEKKIKINNQSALGEEILNINYNNEILEKKLNRLCSMNKFKLKIIFDINIKIGNLIKYNENIYIVHSIEHIISNNEKLSIIFISDFINNSLECIQTNLKKINEITIPIINNEDNILNINNDINEKIFIDYNKINKITISDPKIIKIFDIVEDLSFEF